ncbi:MAG: TetR/AcrR family transcriptional regulator [Actinomycetota bacterium]|nr:TetR/AcrR family transcriptional regulator [Actinomycetota bacterium]
MMRPPRSAGRPTAPLLTQDRILQAAFRLTRERTPRQFTMTALAESLGVRTSALYHHFANRDAVIRAMRGRISAMIDAEWQQSDDLACTLESWGHAYRSAMLAAPGAIVMLATLPIDEDASSFAQYDHVTRLMMADGWPAEKAADAIIAIESFVIGSALDALAPADNMSPVALAETFPAFADAERRRAAASDDPAQRTFAIGLAALIHGLAHWATTRD